MDDATPVYSDAAGPGPDPIRPPNALIALEDAAGMDPSSTSGRAHLVGWILDGRGPIATYRLVIGSEELAGLFTRVGRGFQSILIEAP
jgi:hypothetical protein